MLRGVRLWLGDQLLIDNWTPHALSTNSVRVSLQAGQLYDIRVEYYEVSENATMQLKWLPPGSSGLGAVAIPKGQLLPPVSSPPGPPPPLSRGQHTLLYLHSDDRIVNLWCGYCLPETLSTQFSVTVRSLQTSLQSFLVEATGQRSTFHATLVDPHHGIHIPLTHEVAGNITP